ncbi:MAG: hypothetical protein WBU20_03665, partial [Candidatus Acidiferrum sp.]
LPLGTRALPGSYTVKLTVDGKSYTQPLTLKMDPRVKTPIDDLRRQYEMETGAVQGMNDSYESLEQVKSVREQIKELSKGLRGNQKLARKIEALDRQCRELEGRKQHSFYGIPGSGKQPENFSTINQDFATMLAIADGADAAPTAQANAAYRELADSETALQHGWATLRDRDIPDLNKELTKAGLTPIDPHQPLETELSGPAEGDDEP